MDLDKLVSSLSRKQLTELKKLLNLQLGTPTKEQIEENAVNNFVCPHCDGKKIVKNGHVRGVQRYRCKECKKSFNLMTNTMFHRTQKPLHLWSQCFKLLFEQKSIRDIAKELKISTSTAFYWRHKMLKALNVLTEYKNPVLDGVIEADETYLLHSYKGKKKDMPQAPRKRGEPAMKRGISKEQVCILVASGRGKNSRMQASCLPHPTGQNIKEHLEGHITRESTLVTDGHPSYNLACKVLDMTHIQLSSSKGVKGYLSHSNCQFYTQSFQRFSHPLQRCGF